MKTREYCTMPDGRTARRPILAILAAAAACLNDCLTAMTLIASGLLQAPDEGVNDISPVRGLRRWSRSAWTISGRAIDR